MKKKIINGIEVHYIPVKKYKHMAIALNYYSKANEKNINERNMILDMLENHNRKFKTSNQLNLHLDMLYGARLKSFVFSKGDLMANSFSLKFINKKYLNKQVDLIESAILFLKTLIYWPKTYNKLLTKKASEEAIKEANEIVQTLSQDKESKAYFNYIKAITCKDDNALIFPNEKYLDFITNQTLTDIYQTLIKEDQLKIYIIGDIDESEMDSIIKKTFDKRNKTFDFSDISASSQYTLRENVQELIDYDDVSIGRVFLGYRPTLPIEKRQLDAMILLNTIIGGYSQSLLFTEIREKMQKVYYIYSMYDSNNSIMTVNFEIEEKDIDQVIERVKAIISDIQNGHLSQEHIDLGKNYLIKHYKSSADSLNGLLHLNILADMNNEEGFDLEEKIKTINQIKKNELVDLANQLHLDTVYKFIKEEDKHGS